MRRPWKSAPPDGGGGERAQHAGADAQGERQHTGDDRIARATPWHRMR